MREEKVMSLSEVRENSDAIITVIDGDTRFQNMGQMWEVVK